MRHLLGASLGHLGKRSQRPFNRTLCLGLRFGLGVLILGLTLVTWDVTTVRADGSVGVTVRQVFSVPDQLNGMDTIPLLELIPEAGEGDALLQVSWRAVPTGWFPVWYIEVACRVEGVGRTGTGSVVSLGPVSPTPGGKYELTLSYSPAGVVAVRLVDLASNDTLILQGLAVEPHQGALRAQGVGSLDQYDGYRPIATYWDIVTENEDGQSISVSVLPTDAPVWVQVTMPGIVDGELALRIENGTASMTHVLGPVEGEHFRQRLDPAAIPGGLVTLRLQYMREGDLWWESDPRSVYVGKVMGIIDHPRLNQDTSTVQFDFSIVRSHDFHGERLRLLISLFELEWNASRQQYEEVHYADIVLPVQEHEGADRYVQRLDVPVPNERGLWRIRMVLESDLDVYTALNYNEITFSTRSGLVLGRPGEERALRIGTYNVLGFEGYPYEATVRVLGEREDSRRIAYFANAIRSLQLDILGVQESQQLDWMKQLAGRLGTNLVWFPSAHRFPGAVLTHYPVLETRLFNHAGASNRSAPYSRFGGATLLAVENQLLWIVNVHLHPNDPDLQEAEAKLLGEHIGQLEQLTPYIVVLGDMNSVIGGVADRTLRERGLVNAMELPWIGGVQPTKPDGSRAIDHIYVTLNLAEYVLTGEVYSGSRFGYGDLVVDGEWINSDHLPVVIELGWPPSGHFAVPEHEGG